MFRKALLVAALLGSSAAQAEWYEAKSEHFIVYSEDKPDNVRAFTEKLERFDKAMRAFRLIPDVKVGDSRKVTVYQVEDLGDIRRLTGSDRIAGYYIGRAEGPVAFVPRKSSDVINATTILLHEYSHHLMLTSWTGAAFPKWFVEGFAEMHSTALFRSDGSVIFGANPEHRRWSVGDSSGLPLEKMLKGKTFDDQETPILYARGWLLTHYLTFDKDRLKQLAAYIGAINEGKSIAEASKLLSGFSDTTLDAYGKRPRLPSGLVRADEIKVGQIAIRKLTPGEAAVMPARIHSSSGVNEKTRNGVVEQARRLAAPYPNDPAAQAELAEAEFDVENYAASEAAADRALATDPKSVPALLYKGRAAMEQAKKDKVTDPARWRAIRASFLAANKLDPEDPEPLILFYRSFEAAGQKATKNAQDALVYAYALAPQDFDLRLVAGKVLLQQNKAAQARVAMAPIAFHPHGGEASTSAARVVEALDAKGAAAALAVLEEIEKEAEKKKAEAAGQKKKLQA
jgi:tetratricopeptide (TPR) repeat protein